MAAILAFVLLLQLAAVFAASIPEQTPGGPEEASRKWSISFNYGRSAQESPDTPKTIESDDVAPRKYIISFEQQPIEKVYWNPYNYPVKPRSSDDIDAIPRKWSISFEYGREDLDDAPGDAPADVPADTPADGPADAIADAPAQADIPANAPVESPADPIEQN